MKVKILMIFFAIGLLSSCNNDDNSDFQSTEINFTEIGKGALFGNGQEGITESNLTITTTSEWQTLISQMDSYNNVSDNFTETNIDFDVYLVVAIFLEVKGQGWEVETENVLENENNITISTLETEYATAVMTQPFCIVKIPKTEKIIIVE